MHHAAGHADEVGLAVAEEVGKLRVTAQNRRAAAVDDQIAGRVNRTFPLRRVCVHHMLLAARACAAAGSGSA